MGAGVVILMGIITAEALFPVAYSTSQNTISDLGSTWNPGRIVREPSATIFNATMLVTGAMIAGATVALYRATGRRALWIALGLLGIGVLGVGIFPGTELHGEPVTTGVHPLVSMLDVHLRCARRAPGRADHQRAISRHLRRARARRPGEPRALRRARLDGPRRWRCRALGRLSRRAVAGRIRRLSSWAVAR